MSDAPLNPSARERIAAARAAAGLPAGRTGAAPPPSPSTAADQAGSDSMAAPAGRRGRWLLLGLVGFAALVAGAGGWWLLGRGSGLVEDTRNLQQRVLAGELRGREMTRAVDSIIRNVDQMSRDELKAAREALDTDWRTAYDKGLSAYFDAAEDRRPALLDEAIDRTLAFRQLRFGLNPQASGPYAGRIRRGDRRSRDRKAEKEDESAAARRALAERYAEAVRERAKERKIDMPEWQ
ncbi:MAG: hypothetical protein ACOYK7_12760 [Pirellulales bacterium]